MGDDTCSVEQSRGQRRSLLEPSPFHSHTPLQLRCGSEPCHQPRQPVDLTIPFSMPGSNEENKSIGRKCSLLPAVAFQFNLPPWSGETSCSSAAEDTVCPTNSVMCCELVPDCRWRCLDPRQPGISSLQLLEINLRRKAASTCL